VDKKNNRDIGSVEKESTGHDARPRLLRTPGGGLGIKKSISRQSRGTERTRGVPGGRGGREPLLSFSGKRHITAITREHTRSHQS